MPTPRLTLLTSLLATLLLSSTLVTAQSHTYRWVDQKTGQTVYSDQPPPPAVKDYVQQNGTGVQDSNQAAPSYATRQASEKFPVTLYTSASCVEECAKARELLNGRGVPFTEKMLSTQEDIDALTKLLGSEAGVPSLTVGRQNLRGIDGAAWNNLLDLAGYPKEAPLGAKKSGAFAQ